MISCQFEDGNKASLRHVTVDTVVFNSEKTQILLVLRAMRLLEGGKWGVVGGYMDRDETMEQAARREIYEETGYELESIDFQYFNDNPDRPGEDRQNVSFIFTAVAGKQTGIPDDESSEIHWFDIDKLPDKSKIAFDHAEIIKNCLDGMLKNRQIGAYET
ncbi:NUDIX hydrolase [Candidatus Saccharibacteria bacterium]|nr:NUDIX hydrolase [Candidatus Saccharibacteria bacterium]